MMQSNSMSPVHVYTALIDVLSYRYRLEEDQKSGKLDFKDDLEESLNILNSVNNAVFRVQAISDTIIITCSNHENFLEFMDIIKKVFLKFLERGLFIRGGIAYSRHFESGRLTYSHAIARSYELESNQAIYPRIVIDDNIIEMYKTNNQLTNIFNVDLIVQQNGIYFLHIVNNDNWNNIYEYAKRIYDKDKKNIMQNERAFIKHSWFENYLFSFHAEDSTRDRYIDSIKKI